MHWLRFIPLVPFIPLVSACAGAHGVGGGTNARETPAPGAAELERAAGEADGARVLARDFAVGTVAVSAELTFPGGECVELGVAVARGIVDADLEVYDRDGARLAFDSRPDRFARVRVCGETRTLVVRALAAAGAGDIAIVVTRPRAGDLEPTATFDGTASLAQVVAESLHARGLSVERSLGPVDVEANVPLRVGIDAARDRCVSVVVRGDAPLEAALLAEDGEEIAVDRGEDRELRIERCSSETVRPTSIEIRATRRARVEIVIAAGSAARIGGDPGLGGTR